MAAAIDLSNLQDAIGNLLANDAGVTAILGSHDGRIQGATDPDVPLPYITLGESDSRDASVQFLASKFVRFPVHIWTEERGFAQNKRIEAAVVSLLDDEDPQWSVTGVRVVSSFHERSSFYRDLEDGVRHGIVEFDITVEPA